MSSLSAQLTIFKKGCKAPFLVLSLFYFKASTKKKKKALTTLCGTEQTRALMQAQSDCKKKRNFGSASVFIWILF